eukprot:CAMPEP_0119403842 /NCGR_PEP_ID=MMETSP1334-20130426/143588_1 /TAXON_ID=127549 /ORGANISM="Calcidiscus leptoporus, Strain RCC1130" /LENGTH=257 /DNA_ID=CAMNT_0007427793 /DNA_START=654 /DNA_END=1428 /DNA_ORIENTATION=-
MDHPPALNQPSNVRPWARSCAARSRGPRRSPEFAILKEHEVGEHEHEDGHRGNRPHSPVARGAIHEERGEEEVHEHKRRVFMMPKAIAHDATGGAGSRLAHLDGHKRKIHEERGEEEVHEHIAPRVHDAKGHRSRRNCVIIIVIHQMLETSGSGMFANAVCTPNSISAGFDWPSMPKDSLYQSKTGCSNQPMNSFNLRRAAPGAPFQGTERGGHGQFFNLVYKSAAICLYVRSPGWSSTNSALQPFLQAFVPLYTTA